MRPNDRQETMIWTMPGLTCILSVMLPCATSTMLSSIEHIYPQLSQMISSDKIVVLYEQHLENMRFITPEPDHTPTVLGLLVLGKDPRQFIGGAYIQFLRIDGSELTDPIIDQKEIDGSVSDLLRRLDIILKINISITTSIASQLGKIRCPDYPIVALQQLARNAILHRTYQSTNAPVHITWYADRVEILSPGNPFGQVNQKNFGTSGITDYRNWHLAEAMKNLGYAHRSGTGITLASRELEKNGNPPLEFTLPVNHVLATLKRRSS
jgi:ATP-dependent DNA helicase RecG